MDKSSHHIFMNQYRYKCVIISSIQEKDTTTIAQYFHLIKILT